MTNCIPTQGRSAKKGGTAEMTLKNVKVKYDLALSWYMSTLPWAPGTVLCITKNFEIHPKVQ